MKELILSCKIRHDEYTARASQFFDVPIAERSEVRITSNIELPTNWQIGLINGPSGSGKSTLLRTFSSSDPRFSWDDRALISNFAPISFEDASRCLCSVGLSSIPSWFRPYHVLSTGEKFRADLARTLFTNEEVITIDEFTSVVDRNVAKSTANAVAKYIRSIPSKKVVFASCHDDIIEWLQPDWSYNPIEGVTRLPRGCLQRPKIQLKIFRAKYEAWDLFKQHHYLSADLNKAAKLFVTYWNDIPIACVAVLSLPHPYLKNAWRASRTVVLPDYQGLGIGVRLSDFIASTVKSGGGRFFSKTIHPAMIAYRLNRPNLWKETQHSRQARNPSMASMLKKGWTASDRFCYAFEYIGPASTIEEGMIFWEKV